MGLNITPATQTGFGSMFGYGQPQATLSMPGPAPAANAAPVVPGAVSPKVFGTNTGAPLGLPTNGDMSGLLAPQTNPEQSLAEGMTWGTMPMANKMQTVFGGISTLGKLYSAFQSNKIARESLDFQKKAYKTNADNQRTSFNMALEDRANSRASYSASDTAEADAAAYIQRHKLGG